MDEHWTDIYCLKFLTEFRAAIIENLKILELFN